MIVGSNYFFKDIVGFSTDDIDYLELVENPTTFKDCYQITGHGECIFKWRKCSPNEFLALHIKYNCPMSVGKFLVPEVCKELGIALKDLCVLEPLFDSLDDKHKYEKVIYEFYKENNDFYLTDQQLMLAYQEYKKYRYEN